MSRSGTCGDLRRSGIGRCSAAEEGEEFETLNTHDQHRDKERSRADLGLAIGERQEQNEVERRKRGLRI